MLTNTLNILITFLNSNDDKVREKSVKVFDKAYIHEFLFDCESVPGQHRKDISDLAMKII
jgi:hypothetical protein